jgi:hypothetical protein
MATPPRLTPLLAQLDFARERLSNRMAGSAVDSGDGVFFEIPAMTDEEYLWEPTSVCWSIRRHPGRARPGCDPPRGRR